MYLCSGGSGHIVKIWDLQRKRCIKWLSGHTDTITGVIYNYKDEHLASVSVKGDLILHNLTSGARAAELKDPNGQVLRVVDYSRFSRHILCTAGDDGSVHLWDTTGRSPMVSWPKQHSAPATGVCFSPSSDKIIASAGLDKKLYTFDSATKRHTSCMPFEAPFSSLAYSNDGNLLAVGTNNGRVVFYDVRGKPQRFTVLRAYSSSEDDNPIQSFATTKDTSSRSELSLSSHSDTWIGSRESSSAFFSTKSSLMNPIPTVASVNLQNKVPYSSSTTGMESSSDYHPTSVFMPLGNQIIPSLANLKLEGTVPSALPGRFTTYSERISTSAHFSENVVSTISSSKSKKTGQESKGEMTNIQIARLDASTYSATRAESLPVTSVVLPQPTRSLGLSMDQPQGNSSFSLQLVQRTLEETWECAQRSIHEDVRNLHIDLLRQFHIHEMGMSGLLTSILEKQDELMNEVQSLRRENQQLRQLL